MEDDIGVFLDNENLNMALEFIAYLKNNKISIQWANTNTWKAIKKGTAVCYIKVGIEYDSGVSCYPEFINNNDFKKFLGLFFPI
jgi:hypothetical protein